MQHHENNGLFLLHAKTGLTMIRFATLSKVGNLLLFEKTQLLLIAFAVACL